MRKKALNSTSNWQQISCESDMTWSDPRRVSVKETSTGFTGDFGMIDFPARISRP